MNRHADATQFTLLDPPLRTGAGQRSDLGAEDLARLYAYDRTSDPCLRVNFVTSIDGAVTVGGTSGGLGGGGDHAIFGLLRRLADVIVVGAGTVRTENYGGARVPEAAQRARRNAGQEAVPRIAVVTAGARLDPAHRIFHDTAVAPLIVAGPEASPERLDSLRDVGADIATLAYGTTEGDGGTRTPHGRTAVPPLLELPGSLAARGYGRIRCEGGPGLTGRLLRDGAVAELCLTAPPLLIGGDGPRLAVAPPAAASPSPMRRRHLLSDDS